MSTTSSFSPVRFPLFAAFFVDPGLVVSVIFSPAIITVPVLSCASVAVPCVNVVVSGDVYGAVVAGGGHVNIPTFLELQIRSLIEVQNRKIMQSSVSNSKQRTKQNLAIKKLRKNI